MRRREFIAGLASAVGMPSAAWTQQGGMRRIGILMPFAPASIEHARVRVFREELRKKGWASGVNAQFDERWTTDNLEVIRAAAANLVELKPDVILAVGGRVIPILRQLTQTIPIVVPGGSDPVSRGWAETLARPGGNITGFSTMEVSVIGKMMQVLKEMAPSISRATIIYNPENPSAHIFRDTFLVAAGNLGIEPTISHVHGVAEIERAIADAAKQAGRGIFIPLDVTISAFREKTVAAMASHRLPAIYSEREYVEMGGLAFYGTNRIEVYRGAASYVDRILRGEKPGELPYQQPAKYELVINRKTAITLGLSIPPKLLFTADEVIE